MPRYEYHCPECKTAETTSSPIGGPRVVPECNVCKRPMLRVPSAPNFTIKGYSAKNGYSSKG